MKVESYIPKVVEDHPAHPVYTDGNELIFVCMVENNLYQFIMFDLDTCLKMSMNRAINGKWPIEEIDKIAKENGWEPAPKGSSVTFTVE